MARSTNDNFDELTVCDAMALRLFQRRTGWLEGIATSFAAYTISQRLRKANVGGLTLTSPVRSK